MRFIRKRPSGADKDIMVYEFAFGIDELKIILESVMNTRKSLPQNLIELNPIRNRLWNIKRELQKVLDEYNKEKE